MASPTYRPRLSRNLTSPWGYNQSPLCQHRRHILLAKSLITWGIQYPLIHIAGYKIFPKPKLAARHSSHPLVRGNSCSLYWEKETLCFSSTAEIVTSFYHCSVSICFIYSPRILIYIFIRVHGSLHRPCKGWIPIFGLRGEVCHLPRAFNQLTVCP